MNEIKPQRFGPHWSGVVGKLFKKKNGFIPPSDSHLLCFVFWFYLSAPARVRIIRLHCSSKKTNLSALLCPNILCDFVKNIGDREQMHSEMYSRAGNTIEAWRCEKATWRVGDSLLLIFKQQQLRSQHRTGRHVCFLLLDHQIMTSSKQLTQRINGKCWVI